MESSLDTLGYIYSYTNLSLYSGSTQVRGNIEVWYTQQWMVSRNRLTGKYINSSPSYLTGENSLPQILFINNTATGAVNQTNALLHASHNILVNHIAGGISKRHMNGNKISLFNNLIKGTNSNAHILAAFLIDIWIVTDNLHVKGQSTLGYTAADTAHADNAQSLAFQLNTGVFFAVPLALLESFIGNRNMTSHSHHHGKGMLSGSNGITPWRINNNNALVGGSSNINIIYTYTGTADNLQILGSCNNLSSYLGGRADNQSIIVRNNRQQLLSGQLVTNITIKFVLQNVYSHLGNAICD